MTPPYTLPLTPRVVLVLAWCVLRDTAIGLGLLVLVVGTPALVLAALLPWAS